MSQPSPSHIRATAVRVATLRRLALSVLFTIATTSYQTTCTVSERTFNKRQHANAKYRVESLTLYALRQFPFQGTLHGQGPKKTGGMGRRLKFLFFFVNRFDCCFFFFYSVLPSSLSNARLHFHVIHPHLIIRHKVLFSSCFISFFLF